MKYLRTNAFIVWHSIRNTYLFIYLFFIEKSSAHIHSLDRKKNAAHSTKNITPFSMIYGILLNGLSITFSPKNNAEKSDELNGFLCMHCLVLAIASAPSHTHTHSWCECVWENSNRKFSIHYVIILLLFLFRLFVWLFLLSYLMHFTQSRLSQFIHHIL